MKRVCVLLCLLLASACGGQQGTATLSATKAPAATRKPIPPTEAGPQFATPEAAMRYLASAWNRTDLAQLKHVTDPAARNLLLGMHSEATNLSLDHCTFTKERGDYECFFNHDFPKGYKSKGPHGTAEFTVGPARKPGWYMTYFVDCGG